MDVPAEIQIKHGIVTGSVYYFSHDDFTTDEPHYFVVLNDAPQNSEDIVMVVATSQIDKVKRIYNQMPLSTLVEVLPNECSLFSLHTIFNCNSIIEIPLQVLIDKLGLGELKKKDCIPAIILERIVKGVHDSPQVAREIKKRLPKP